MSSSTFAGGEPSHNVISVVHPELRLELRTAIFQTLQGNRSVESRRVRLMRDGHPFYVKMTARPARDPDAADDFVLVLFDEVEDIMDAEGGAQREGSKDPLIAQLERELQRTRDQLQATIEQSETSTEELTASNEELQAINEELRSATEELETGKEELQSINEELVTVNAELKSKVEETAKINDDLQNLITANDIGTIFVDRAMHIKRFTPRAADVFNIIPSDVGRPLFDITHRLEYDGLAADTAAAFKSLRQIEREVKSTHGHWYIARFMPYRTTEDRIDGAVLTFIDITARREAEDRLHEGERRMRVVAESTKEYAIITLDDNGLIVTWNAGASRMFGFEEGEVIGRPFASLYPRDEREQGVPDEDLQRAREEGRVEANRWHVRKDGSRLCCSGVLMRLDDNGLRGFAKIAREVNVEDADRKRDEFIAAVSHKLKSPLNLIYANAELLARSPDAHRSLQVSRAADTIRRSAISQARLIDNLLDMSRLRAGELTINFTAVDWREIVDRICDALDEEARDKGIALVRNLPDNPVIIQADLARMEQVVWNLVGNALKSLGAGRVGVTLAEDGNAATLKIADDGSGIDAALLPHVFDMVERGRPSFGRDDGLNIGLFLVKELVGRHGGTIQVESAGIASGACFTVVMPLRRDSIREAGDGQHQAMPLQGLHILMVDEDVSASEAFKLLLSAEGARVTCANSGKDAIQAVEANTVDFVLSGLNASGHECIDLVAALRAKPENARLPVIALSGVVQHDDKLRAMQAGYSAYLTKPVALDDLLAAIARVRAGADA
ncbi:PAS domain-containing protein [Cupriavidus necator]